MTTPQDDHARATPHAPEREPLTPIESIPVRDILFLASFPGLVIVIIVMVLQNWK